MVTFSISIVIVSAVSAEGDNSDIEYSLVFYNCRRGDNSDK